MQNQKFQKKDETFEKIEKFLEENGFSQVQIELWLDSKGCIVITQSQYDNLTPIDPDGDVP